VTKDEKPAAIVHVQATTNILAAISEVSEYGQNCGDEKADWWKSADTAR
jgi:hypothetical protein